MRVTSPRNDEAAGETLAALAAQVADLRGQVALIGERLTAAGVTGDLNLAARFEELAQTVADALDAAAPCGPSPVFWLGLDEDARNIELGNLREWADKVLRGEYGIRADQIRPCWPSHKRAVWELSTLAAEWHRTYGGKRPDRDRALDFYDRWLPNTVRRIRDEITMKCNPECVLTPRKRAS
jgi:hypothetical protein